MVKINLEILCKLYYRNGGGLYVFYSGTSRAVMFATTYIK